MESRASSTSRLRDKSRKLESDARSFASGIDELISDVEQMVRGRFEHQPYTMLAAAVGAGFVLGGGLTPAVIASLARMGSRAAVGAAMQGALARILTELQPAASDDLTR